MNNAARQDTWWDELSDADRDTAAIISNLPAWLVWSLADLGIAVVHATLKTSANATIEVDLPTTVLRGFLDRKRANDNTTCTGLDELAAAGLVSGCG